MKICVAIFLNGQLIYINLGRNSTHYFGLCPEGTFYLPNNGTFIEESDNVMQSYTKHMQIKLSWSPGWLSEVGQKNAKVYCKKKLRSNKFSLHLQDVPGFKEDIFPDSIFYTKTAWSSSRVRHRSRHLGARARPRLLLWPLLILCDINFKLS